MLVQWFQLYEIDPSLVASVIRALGDEFPHYAVFAPSDHDLLIILIAIAALILIIVAVH